MAKSIKNRVFGSDVPPLVKKKIQARQALAFKDRLPGEEIQSSIGDDTTGIGSTFGDLHNNNFSGIADLSSRTPFARMWTAVNITRDVPVEPPNILDTDEKVRKWYKEREGIIDQV